MGAHNSVVGADQGFRAPSGDQESAHNAVHEDSASARIAAGQRPRPSFRHPRPVFLATVEDLFSRRMLGFAQSDRHPTAELATDALNMAAAVRGGTVAGVIFHTDKGSFWWTRQPQKPHRTGGFRLRGPANRRQPMHKEPAIPRHLDVEAHLLWARSKQGT